MYSEETENINNIILQDDDDDYDEVESQVNEQCSNNTTYLNKYQISSKKNELKKLDPDYHTMIKTINNKKKRIEMYSTSINSGRKIREAISGLYSNFRTGSSNEDLFFKVRMTNFGSINSNIVLYYYNIDDFERHQKTKVSEKVREEWCKKRSIREKELHRT
jgi:hypothetical protein